MIIEWYRELFLFLWKYLGIFGGLVGISVVVSLVCLPLYHVIGRIVGMENALQSVLNPAVAKIKVTCSDAAERQSAIERLYARFGYHPIMGVRKVLPLFVAIPFLLLTYHMLSSTSELEGVKWLCFSDLSKPDGLLFGFNLLPFVMTGVNILTVYATPCFNKKDEVQAWVIALFFLVLLYTANTALMIYWTLNQIFNFGRTLCENHFAGARLLACRVACAVRDIRHPSTDVLAYCTFYLFLLSACLYFIHNSLPFGACGPTMLVSTYGMILVLCLAHVVSFVYLKRIQATPMVLLHVCTWPPVAYVAYIVCCFVFAKQWYQGMRFNGSWLAPETCIVFYVALVPFLIPYVCNAFGRAFHTGKLLLKTCCHEWHLFLLPIALGIHYSYASEGFILPIPSVALFCLYILTACIIAVVLFALLFGNTVKLSVLVKSVMVFAIGYFLVPMISTETGALAYTRNIPLRLAMPVVMLVLLLYVRQVKVVRVFVMLLALSIVVNAAVNKSTDKMSAKEVDRSRTEAFLAKHSCVKTNNVYLLIYDGYAHKVVRDALSLNDPDFSIEDYLGRQGFIVYDAYSTGSHTIQSMSEAFTIGGISGESPRATMSGDNLFNDFLSTARYRTCYVTDCYSMPNKGERMPASFYFPTTTEMVRPENVLWRCVNAGFMSQAPQTFNDYSPEDFRREEYRLFASFGQGGNFIYAHWGQPGHCVQNLKFRKNVQAELNGYKDRLRKADRTIQSDVGYILSKDKNAIIIVAGDHGGYLVVPEKFGQFDARNILDYHGILLAIHWPDDYRETIKIECLQDVLPEVMAYLSQDSSLSSLKSEGATFQRIGPAGFVKHGIIQQGEQKGMRLSDAARAMFGK